MADRIDPLRGFRFVVEMNGLLSGGFTRVKGLSREIKHESFREGGVNDYEHKLATQVSYPVLVLERGLAFDELWTWALAAAEGDIQRRMLWIRLQDEAGAPGWGWHIDGAFPVKWSVSDLDAQASPVAMESLELAHHGLRKAT